MKAEENSLGKLQRITIPYNTSHENVGCDAIPLIDVGLEARANSQDENVDESLTSWTKQPGTDWLVPLGPITSLSCALREMRLGLPDFCPTREVFVVFAPTSKTLASTSKVIGP